MNRLNLAIVCLITLAICAAGSWAQGIPQQEPQDTHNPVFQIPPIVKTEPGPKSDYPNIVQQPVPKNPTPGMGPEPPPWGIHPAPPDPGAGGGGFDGGRWREYWKCVLKLFQPAS